MEPTQNSHAGTAQQTNQQDADLRKSLRLINELELAGMFVKVSYVIDGKTVVSLKCGSSAKGTIPVGHHRVYAKVTDYATSDNIIFDVLPSSRLVTIKTCVKKTTGVADIVKPTITVTVE